MNQYAKIALFLIGLAAFLYGTIAHADPNNSGLRCGSHLIGIGDPQYVVESECGAPTAQRVINKNGHDDEVYDYYKQSDSVTTEVHLIDGHVYSIEDIYTQ